jgi:biotin-(acetyl-CoA carboxylase) ligase
MSPLDVETTMLIEEPIAPTVRDRLCIDVIRRSLRTDVVGFEIHLFDAVASTSDVMRGLVEAGARDGAVVLVEADFAISILVRRSMAAYDVPGLMFVASVALADAMASEGLAGEPRWPSRVVLDGRTVAETDAAVGARGWRVDHVVLGVRIGDALDVDRNRFVAQFLNRFERWLAIHTERGAAAVVSAWTRRPEGSTTP